MTTDPFVIRFSPWIKLFELGLGLVAVGPEGERFCLPRQIVGRSGDAQFGMIGSDEPASHYLFLGRYRSTLVHRQVHVVTPTGGDSITERHLGEDCPCRAEVRWICLDGEHLLLSRTVGRGRISVSSVCSCDGNCDWMEELGAERFAGLVLGGGSIYPESRPKTSWPEPVLFRLGLWEEVDRPIFRPDGVSEVLGETVASAISYRNPSGKFFPFWEELGFTEMKTGETVTIDSRGQGHGSLSDSEVWLRHIYGLVDGQACCVACLQKEVAGEPYEFWYDHRSSLDR